MMTGTVRARSEAFTAAISGAIVIASLTSLPPEPLKHSIARAELAAVQLQAAVSTLADVAASNSGTLNVSAPSTALQGSTTTAPVAPAAAANPALLMLALPLWYIAFPITLPINIAFWVSVAMRSPSFGGNRSLAIRYGVSAGLRNFFSMPLPLLFLLQGAASTYPAAAERQGRTAPAATVQAETEAQVSNDLAKAQAGELPGDSRAVSEDRGSVTPDRVIAKSAAVDLGPSDSQESGKITTPADVESSRRGAETASADLGAAGSDEAHADSTSAAARSSHKPSAAVKTSINDMQRQAPAAQSQN